nr:hypothetical protein Iba_chr09cCG5890 [Ipomoea batatas]
MFLQNYCPINTAKVNKVFSSKVSAIPINISRSLLERSEIGFEAVESEEAQARGVIGRGGGDADQIASVDDEGSDYYDDEAYEEAGPDVTRSGQVVDEPHWGKAVLSGLGFVPASSAIFHSILLGVLETSAHSTSPPSGNSPRCPGPDSASSSQQIDSITSGRRKPRRKAMIKSKAEEDV